MRKSELNTKGHSNKQNVGRTLTERAKRVFLHFSFPLKHFPSNSDIDWSRSIGEIDEQLYEKYELEKDDIEFIERMIKPME